MSKLIRRTAVAAGWMAVIVALAGCWPVPGQDANRTAFNEDETGITPENVGNLSELWTATGSGQVGNPVVSPGGVHAVRHPCVLTTVDPATGALRWSAGTTPSRPQRCGRSVETVSGDPYVIGDSVYVGAETQTRHRRSCDGFTRGFDVTTGDLTSETNDGTLEAFRDLAARDFPNLVAGTDCTYDPASQEYVRSATLRQLGQPARDLLVPGGFPNTTFWEGGALIQAGPGPLATQPEPPQTIGHGVRAYNLEPIPFCGPDGRQTCPRWVIPTDGEVRGHPVLGLLPGGTGIYVGTSAGTVYAIEPSGFVSWTASVGAPVTASPAVAPLFPGTHANVVHVPTADGRIVTLDVFTGTKLWEDSTGTGSPIQVQPAVGGEVLYAASADGHVHAFDASGCGPENTCSPLWSASTGSAITGAPAISNGQLYVGTADGRLIAYGLH